MIAAAIDAYDPAAGAALTIYAATGQFKSKTSDTPSDQLFSPILPRGRAYNRRVSIFDADGFIGGSAPEEIGAVEVAIGGSDTVSTSLGEKPAADLATYNYSRRLMKLWRITDENPGLTDLVFIGYTEAMEASRSVMTLHPTNKAALDLGKPMQDNLFRGLEHALRFDGVNDFVDIADASELDRSSGTWTIEFAARLMGDSGDAVQNIVIKNLNYSVWINTSGELQAYYWTGGLRHALASTHVLSSGLEMEHVSVVWESTLSQSKVYVDGEDVGATYSSSSATQNLTNNLRFGALSAESQRAEVDLAFVRLWDTARTQGQIEENLFSYIVLPTETGLRGMLHVNESTGTTVADETSAGNNGTISGATWIHSLDGPSTLKGVPKPISVGAVRNRKAIPVDPGRLIYQVHDGSMVQPNKVRVNYQEISLDTTKGVDGDVSDIFATTPDTDKWISKKDWGLIKLATAPQGAVVTCEWTSHTSPVGSESDSAKTPAAPVKPGDVCQRVLERYGGILPSDIDTTSISSLNTDAGDATVGIGLAEEDHEVLDVLPPTLNGIAGFFYTKRNGVYAVARLEPPQGGTPVRTLTERDIDVKGMRLLAEFPPIAEMKIGHTKFWYVHSAAEVATSESQANIQRATTEYEWVEAQSKAKKADFPGWSRFELETWVAFEDAMINMSPVPDYGAQVRHFIELYSAHRRLLEVPLLEPDSSLWIPDVIDIDLGGLSHPPFGLSTNTNFLVAGLDETDRRQALIVWG